MNVASLKQDIMLFLGSCEMLEIPMNALAFVESSM